MVGAHDQGRAGGDYETAEGEKPSWSGAMNMEYVNNFYSAINSLNGFDHAEVHNIVSGQLAPTLRETPQMQRREQLAGLRHLRQRECIQNGRFDRYDL